MVVNKACGSALMRDTLQARRIIEALIADEETGAGLALVGE